jgi:mRNA interferase RelE/StbE
MTWTFEFSKNAEKQFKKLDVTVQSRIKKAVLERMVINPKLALIPLAGDKVGLYKFRVGDYRLLCSRDDDTLHVLVVKVKHRKDIYRT